MRSEEGSMVAERAVGIPRSAIDESWFESFSEWSGCASNYILLGDY